MTKAPTAAQPPGASPSMTKTQIGLKSGNGAAHSCDREGVKGDGLDEETSEAPHDSGNSQQQ